MARILIEGVYIQRNDCIICVNYNKCFYCGYDLGFKGQGQICQNMSYVKSLSFFDEESLYLAQ